ncbi:MAG: D,D-heptose 1,7-bisphosphate phosphatase, partial [Candidatus Firestonebacteria bacterium]|nr:D,D-heptose 1,7-bisphosphate phosphatase [Candidatus Firestonebacteria bacterium]
MQAIILAGWKTTTKPDTPDSMIEIEGRPFIEYQLEMLKKNRIDNIIVCPGHLGQNIHFYFNTGEDFGINLHFSEY